MTTITSILALAIAIEFFYIMYLETIATSSKKTAKVFNIPVKNLEDKFLSTLFKNQGIYNGLIGVGILYGVFIAPHSLEIVIPILYYIVSVALYGALTSDKKIILTQGGLAIITLILIALGL